MLFSSTIFLYIFLPIVLFGYYVLFRPWRSAQNVFLFIASMLFYAWGEPRFALIMLVSVFINWLFGIWVHFHKQRGMIRCARLVIALDCIFNLGLLFVFKYLSFASSVLCGWGLATNEYSIALPIGISFFTFQAMSYVIDVYRGRGDVQKNILNVGLYIAFFPQLIAGPIVRYETVAEEIKNRRETLADFGEGFSRFILGMGKKILLANGFAILADKTFGIGSVSNGLSFGMAWLGAIAYTMQIFFDFSGYSDMAIGLGRMFGFHFLENFDYPYISSSITEFWRRWHISLGTWFRDYVYIPLGGSRVKTKTRLIINLFVVWLLTGIWHGAEWSFVVWGLMYFVLLCIEKLTGKTYRIFGHIYTLFFVVMGWVLFRADDMGSAFKYFEAMFSIGQTGFDGMFWGYFTQNIPLIIFGIMGCVPLVPKINSYISKFRIYPLIRVTAYLCVLVLCLASLVTSSYNPFIYFNF